LNINVDDKGDNSDDDDDDDGFDDDKPYPGLYIVLLFVRMFALGAKL
jgi:hypothetical protein